LSLLTFGCPNDYFAPVTSVHTHLTRKATHGKHFWHSFSSEHGKRSIRHHGRMIWGHLIIHCSDCLLLHSENVIEPTLSLSMRKKAQHFSYLFQSFLTSNTVVPKLSANYPPGVICDSSGGNAEPKPHFCCILWAITAKYCG